MFRKLRRPRREPPAGLSPLRKEAWVAREWEEHKWKAQERKKKRNGN